MGAHERVERRLFRRRAITLTNIARVAAKLRRRIAAELGHEIRQPLSVIRVAIDEVRWRTADLDDVADLLEDIDDATERIMLIVQDLATLARPIDDPLASVDLVQVVASATRLAFYRQRDNVTLEIGPLTTSPVVGNAPRLVQVILNLLVNAGRATAPQSVNHVRVTAAEAGDHVVLSIADSGTGMTPETLARAFDPFFTTSRDRGGTGLGLPISRSLVERMGGSLAIRSTLGEGTTVDVTLKRATTS